MVQRFTGYESSSCNYPLFFIFFFYLFTSYRIIIRIFFPSQEKKEEKTIPIFFFFFFFSANVQRGETRLIINRARCKLREGKI